MDTRKLVTYLLAKMVMRGSSKMRSHGSLGRWQRPEAGTSEVDSSIRRRSYTARSAPDHERSQVDGQMAYEKEHWGGVVAMGKKLTNREIEVLKWASYGKTSREISEILIISVNTVNFHVKNAMMKLETANKTATVARASMLGLLS
ncbi:MAG TPA: helix-turn-helix transcriptional regulator [Arenibaculum sp.]|nr:helix-turn-helix transcriptional regulator [Arenibaculum sp.]